MPRKSQLLEDLNELIGYAATLDLLRAWGGRRLFVPTALDPTPGKEHPIVLTIGWEAASRLVSMYGAQALDLPAERNSMIELRNSRIVADLEHMSCHEVARKYGVSPRHARYIRARHQEKEQAET